MLIWPLIESRDCELGADCEVLTVENLLWDQLIAAIAEVGALDAGAGLWTI